jgi:dihydrofolate reductase
MDASRRPPAWVAGSVSGGGVCYVRRDRCAMSRLYWPIVRSGEQKFCRLRSGVLGYETGSLEVFKVLVSLVVAMDEKGVIGRDNALPWHLPADLRYFKTLTMGKPLIMGRNTYESIGRPLPGRQNIVLTRDSGYQAPGCDVCAGLEQALDLAGSAEEVMIIGGGALYESAMELADRIYLTEVHAEIQGDTWFPEIDRASWRELRRERHTADAKNAMDYSFVVLERRAAAD